jgi:hypothetical protein
LDVSKGVSSGAKNGDIIAHLMRDNSNFWVAVGSGEPSNDRPSSGNKGDGDIARGGERDLVMNRRSSPITTMPGLETDF